MNVYTSFLNCQFINIYYKIVSTDKCHKKHVIIMTSKTLKKERRRYVN